MLKKVLLSVLSLLWIPAKCVPLKYDPFKNEGFSQYGSSADSLYALSLASANPFAPFPTASNSDLLYHSILSRRRVGTDVSLKAGDPFSSLPSTTKTKFVPYVLSPENLEKEISATAHFRGSYFKANSVKPTAAALWQPYSQPEETLEKEVGELPSHYRNLPSPTVSSASSDFEASPWSLHQTAEPSEKYVREVPLHFRESYLKTKAAAMTAAATAESPWSSLHHPTNEREKYYARNPHYEAAYLKDSGSYEAPETMESSWSSYHRRPTEMDDVRVVKGSGRPRHRRRPKRPYRSRVKEEEEEPEEDEKEEEEEDYSHFQDEEPLEAPVPKRRPSHKTRQAAVLMRLMGKKPSVRNQQLISFPVFRFDPGANGSGMNLMMGGQDSEESGDGSVEILRKRRIPKVKYIILLPNARKRYVTYGVPNNVQAVAKLYQLTKRVIKI